jgi:hypothetical protein
MMSGSVAVRGTTQLRTPIRLGGHRYQVEQPDLSVVGRERRLEGVGALDVAARAREVPGQADRE